MTKNVKFQTYKNNLLFFLLGFFVFSSLSSTIVQTYLHFPISLPELLFAPFVFLLWDKFKSIRFSSKDFVVTFAILIVLLLLGLLCGEFPLYSMLATSRSWFYLLMCMFAFSRSNRINSNDLMWLAFGSVIAWFVDSLLNYRQLVAGLLLEEQVITYGLLLAVPVLLATLIYRSRYLFVLICIVIISITVIFAGIRRLLVVALLSLFISFLLKVFNSKKQVFSFAIMGLIIAALVSFSLPIIGDFVKENSPAMYYRVFERTGNYLETGSSGSSGDSSRLNHIEKFFDDFLDHTVPYGMVSSNTRDKGAGYFNDFPLYQLNWIFSWPVVLLILFYILRVLLLNLRKYNRNNDEVGFVSVNCIIVMFMLLFLEGTYIAFPFATPITGVLLGRSIRNSKQSKS